MRGRWVVLLVWACATAARAQLPIDQLIRDLQSPDGGRRLRAVDQLKANPHADAALPLAKAVTDARDEVQLSAIAAELNIFLSDAIVPRRRVGLLVEVRNQIAAEAIFSAGPLALGSKPVPPEVLSALRAAARDDQWGVRLEALYAFGALAVEPRDTARRELLDASGPDLAAMIGAQDAVTRVGALRVLGRVFERRPDDPAIEETVGDAVISALNDREPTVQLAAMDALGAMRYERAVGALTELFRYRGKGTIAEAALDGIARIAHASSGDLLVAQLSAKTSDVKGIALEGVARLGERSHLAVVQAALAAERSEPARLAGSYAIAALSDGPLEPLIEALGSTKLRDQAFRYLTELGQRSPAALAPHLRDKNARVRGDLVNAFALGRNGSALNLVEPLTGDADPQVARAAARAVVWLK